MEVRSLFGLNSAIKKRVTDGRTDGRTDPSIESLVRDQKAVTFCWSLCPFLRATSGRVSDLAELRSGFLSETVEKLGSLDILVNNAGILEMGTIENTSLEQYDRIMNTNVRAIYQLTMLAVPHLVKTQGEGNAYSCASSQYS